MTQTPEQTGVILGQGPDGEIFVVNQSPDSPVPDPAAVGNHPDEDVAAIVEPAKVMRIGRMISRLLDEVKDAPLDDRSRARLSEIYSQSIDELAGGLDAELGEELRRLMQPFAADDAPSDAELRIAQAQLVGWLEGLFQGLQTALMAQQMVARAQVEQMRKALGQRRGDGEPARMAGLTGGDKSANAGPAAGLYL
ncbi:MAG: bacterial proteasome activator family protein [Propionibacteriaceae bacterium]|jgi:hypothetical protein|nr:bacterial proteasome activator family protein [Propionibacteriaceae bacterium]